MNSQDYWKQREQANQALIIKNQANYQQEIAAIYNTVQDNIQRDINNFYAKYYNQKEGMSLANVKQAVSDFDVKSFQTKAAQYVKDKDFSPEANERLKLYNLTMKINRLEMLKAEVGLEMLKGSSDLDNTVKSTLLKEAQAEANHQAGILGTTVKALDLSDKTIGQILNSSYKANIGSLGGNKETTFSDRIWGYNDKLKGVLDGLLPQVIIQGKHPTGISSDLSKIFNSSKYEAERLLRTESSRVYGATAIQAIDKSGYSKYKWIAEPGACKICGPMDGQEFDVKDAAFGKSLFPMHPCCRCAIMPVVPEFDVDDYLERGEAAIKEAMKGYDGTNEDQVMKAFDGMMKNGGKSEKTLNNSIKKSYNMFRKSPYRPPFEKATIPHRLSSVRKIISSAGLSLEGAKLKLEDDMGWAGTGILASASDTSQNGKRIDLYHDLFFQSVDEFLITIAHELEHLKQFEKYGYEYVQNNRARFEIEAEQAAQAWFKKYKESEDES